MIVTIAAMGCPSPEEDREILEAAIEALAEPGGSRDDADGKERQNGEAGPLPGRLIEEGGIGGAGKALDPGGERVRHAPPGAEAIGVERIGRGGRAWPDRQVLDELEELREPGDGLPGEEILSGARAVLLAADHDLRVGNAPALERMRRDCLLAWHLIRRRQLRSAGAHP